MNYQWQSSTSFNGTYTNLGNAGASGTATTNVSSAYTTAALASTTYFRVKVTNANGTATSNVAVVTVRATPAAGAITGSSTSCAGQSVAYSIAAVDGATSYTWGYSGSGAVITGGTTNSVTVAFGQNATSGTLSVTANNSCGAGAASNLSVTINPAPFINNITANGCNGALFTVTPTNGVNGVVPSGTTYSWSAPVVTGGMTGGASGSGAATITGTLTNPTASTQTATYTVTPVKGGCTGSTFTVTVSVNPPISRTATPVDAICNGGSTGSVNLSVSGGSPGYSYAWTKTGVPGYSATSQNISGLSAGVYNVTITDSKSCTSTASATVGQPTAIGITPAITDVTCFGGSDGAVSITVSGGTSPYTYLWNDGSASKDRTGLTADSYSVTVTDAASCSQTQAGITVGQATVLSATVNYTNDGCNGASDGTITISSPTGGNVGATYQYRLNTLAWQASGSFTGLAPNTYSVEIRETAHPTCTVVLRNQVISQPAVLAATINKTDVTCFGASDGIIAFSPSGGYGTYEYSKDGGSTWQAGSSFTGLAPGTYNALQIRDAAHPTCTGSLASQTISQPAVLSATVTATNVTCNGSADGTITVSSPAGGYGSYQYSKDGGTTWQSGSVFTGLAPNTYSVKIRDAAHTGCVVLLGSPVISQPAALGASSITVVNVSCNGAGNGSITITPSGGSGSYEYSIDGGTNWQASATFSGLAPGTYNSMKIRDAAHPLCSASLASQTITQPVALSLSSQVASVTNVNCNGGADGAVSLTVSGGTAAFTYSWTASGGGSVPVGQSASQNLTGLVAGTYLVGVTDSKGCTVSGSYSVAQPAPFNISLVLVQPDCPPPAATGSITVNVTGGTSGYTYSIDGATFQGSNQFTLLTAGSYTITVKDSKNCTATKAATLSAQTPLPSTPGAIRK